MNRLFPLSFVFALLYCGSAVRAQITITQTDLQNFLVNSKRMEHTLEYSPGPMVNLGTASASEQTFDFSGLPPESGRDSTSLNFVETAGQPGASNFPTANLCTPVVLEPFPGAEVTFVVYMRIQSDGLYQVGSYARQLFPPFVDTTVIERNVPQRLLIPLPLTYGSTGSSVDTVVADSANEDFTVTTTTMTCDGWGDITYPVVLSGASSPKGALISGLRGTQTEIQDDYTGGVLSSRTKAVSVFYISADGTLLSIDQPDTGYTGGNAEVQSLNYSVRLGTSDVRQVSPSVPAEFSLAQNYPNPFNPSTTIGFAIPEAGHVSLRIYDVLGREVAVLVNARLAPGTYEAPFDAAGLPTGVYIYRLSSPAGVDTRKMNVVK